MVASVLLVREFFVTRNIMNASFAELQGLVIAPYACELVDIRTRYAVASVSGEIYPVHANNGSSLNNQKYLLTPSFTSVSGPPTSVPDINMISITAVRGISIPADNLIGLKPAGDFTDIRDLNITLRLRAKVGIKDTGMTELVLTPHMATSLQATNQIVLVTPFKCQLLLVKARYRTASVSGEMDVVTVPTGVAAAAGTSLLNSPRSTINALMSLSGRTNRVINGSIFAVPDNIIPEGRAIGLRFSGNLAGLKDLNVTLVVRQTKTTQVSRLY